MYWISCHTLIESRLYVWDFSAATSVYCDVESSKLRLAMGVGKLRYGGEVNEILGHGDWGAMRVARTRHSSGGEAKVGLGTEGGVVK